MNKQIQLKSNQKISLKDNKIIERVYTLGDSEIISKNIVDLIIYLAYHKIRNKYISGLKKKFVNKYVMKLINELTNVDLHIEHQPELTENSNVLIKEIKKPRIDNWASDKVLVDFKFDNDYIKPIIEVVEEELSSSPNFKRSSVRRTTTKMRKGTLIINDRSIVRNSDFTRTREDGKLSIIPKFEDIKEKKIKKDKIEEFPKNRKNEELDNTPQIDLNPLKSECKEEIKGFDDKDKDKAIILYFREKEAERIRKLKNEAELLADEEKKKKQALEDPLPTMITDSLGNLLKTYQINTDKLRGLAESKFIIRTEEELKEYKELLKLKENKQKDWNITIEKKNPPEKFQISEKIKKTQKIFLYNEVIQEPVPELYFQPEPIKSHVLSEGVNMTYYNQKKRGGNFPKIPDKMDKSDFNNILSQLKPKTYQKKEEEQSIGKISEVPEENYINTV